jgi:hypothetical protein
MPDGDAFSILLNNVEKKLTTDLQSEQCSMNDDQYIVRCIDLEGRENSID